MSSGLLNRRPTAPAPETWTPEGTIVLQRYRNALGPAEGAIVLVYTADTLRSRYAVACLGCSYREAGTGSGWFTENDAGRDANAHATHCRALNRGVPERPDADTAEALIRAQVENTRDPVKAGPVHLGDFHGLRVDLQRTTDWIKHALFRIAQSQPDLLTATPASPGGGTRFDVQPYSVA
ncbi:hypothetical protein OG985_50000 (plasmid) [Streptomyces sp. NBC_00289]|uniref:hypothetical protein n=1 Tax=Streptomyces sp. NBC_00289 TaxID=2975703 RepID=UPI002F908CFF